jgi:hypothetical protein
MNALRHHECRAPIAFRASIRVEATAGIGAERKHVILLRDFRSLRKNGHSRYAIRRQGLPKADPNYSALFGISVVRLAFQPGGTAPRRFSNTLRAAFDNTESRLDSREWHVERHDRLSQPF